MPEGPQMIFLKEQTEPFVGQRVVVAQGSAAHIPFECMEEQPLKEIKTFGKELLFCFPAFTIRIHLLLFGKYAINGELNRALKLGLEFENGYINFYACHCRFISEPLDQVYDWRTDVMHPGFDQNIAFYKLRKQPKKLISDALLDQHILAGVGNGIKNEVLFRSHIHPASVVSEIPDQKLKNLVQACVQFSSEYLAWKHEGPGVAYWQVYRQKTCPRDYIPLQKQKIGKSARTSYFCDKCHELYVPDNDL
jgi:endonuclease-8